MSTLFTFCALVGGTFLFCQFLMTLIGLGHGGFDVDASHVPSDSLTSHAGDPLHDDVDAAHQHGSSWLFGIISFRTLVAAITFFGLTGMTALSAGMPVVQQLLFAVASGGAAMFAVHGLMRFLYQLGQSGTLRLKNAIGKTATVAITIPGKHRGLGKVRLTVQGRFEELAAVNSLDETLTTGSQVIVVDVVDGNVLEVAPLEETS
jgi:membrane protein implicated in regulation of membrane protease activity